MGACGSSPQTTAVWESFFNRSISDAVKYQHSAIQDLNGSTDLSAVLQLAEKYQGEFSVRNVSLAKTIFKAYDSDKDGYLTTENLHSIMRDSISIVKRYTKATYADICTKIMKNVLEGLEKKAQTENHTLSPQVAVIMRRRMDIVVEEISAASLDCLTNLQRNIPAYSLAIAQMVSPQQTSRISSQDFCDRFLVAYCKVVDPFAGALHTPVQHADTSTCLSPSSPLPAHARGKHSEAELYYDITGTSAAAGAADGTGADGVETCRDDSDSGLNVELGASGSDSDSDEEQQAALGLRARVPVTRGFGSPTHTSAAAHAGQGAGVGAGSGAGAGGVGGSGSTSRSSSTQASRPSMSMYVNAQSPQLQPNTASKNAVPSASSISLGGGGNQSRTVTITNSSSSLAVSREDSLATPLVVDLCDLPLPTCEEGLSSRDGDDCAAMAKKTKKTKRKKKQLSGQEKPGVK